MLKATLVTAASTELGGAFSAERWAYAGRMTLLGMVMIFAVLGLLWAVLAVFKLVMVGKEAKPAQKNAIAEAIAESASVAEEPEAVDDGELVAVIAAAIATYRASEGMDAADASAFRVVSFCRAANGRAWNANR